jgi:hypothetical protein
MFHQYSFRGKDLIVQLQPTDALLCITNLPISFTLEEFEELVRAYGNIERCFLVYSEVTGHSKGYGFVEYMKKDFAAKARLELLGKQLGASALFAQWMDVNLLASELIHSKCLCIDKLPTDYRDSEELVQLFSSIHKPVFCQVCIYKMSLEIFKKYLHRYLFYVNLKVYLSYYVNITRGNLILLWSVMKNLISREILNHYLLLMAKQ